MGPEPAKVTAAIVRWFRRAHRDLPWRRTKDPYAIWVSEIMLQQTRVDAVVPYYERFLARFPTVESLARAKDEQVLRAWAGLGYYRRAKQLHAAAGIVVRDHAGELPEDEISLLALPGIGRYTAGAIRSIAFGEPAPIVDGNVARVLSRVWAVRGGPGDPKWEKRMWILAAQLVPAKAASDFNQGLMELGATVCTPRAPQCPVCPLRKLCVAHTHGREEAYPAPRVRPVAKRVARWAILRVRKSDGAVLMRRRAAQVVNGGQWEVPLKQPAKLKPGDALYLGKLRHAILDTTYEVDAFLATGPSRAAKAPDRWVTSDDMDELHVTTLTRKLLRLVERAEDLA